MVGGYKGKKKLAPMRRGQPVWGVEDNFLGRTVSQEGGALVHTDIHVHRHTQTCIQTCIHQIASNMAR